MFPQAFMLDAQHRFMSQITQPFTHVLIQALPHVLTQPFTPTHACTHTVYILMHACTGGKRATVAEEQRIIAERIHMIWLHLRPRWGGVMGCMVRGEGSCMVRGEGSVNVQAQSDTPGCPKLVRGSV